MTASDTQGTAWSRLWDSIRGGLSLRAAILACLSLALAAESVKLFDLVRMELSPDTAQPPTAQIPHLAAPAREINLSAITSAHLFGRYDPASAREPAAEERQALSLSGILFYGGKTSLSRIMLMEYPKATFAVGDRVTGDVVVGAISPRYAILSDGGRQRILRLSWRKRNAGAAGGELPNGNFNDDLDASNDEQSKPPPVLEPYEDPVGDG